MKRNDMRMILRVLFCLMALIMTLSLMCTGVAATPAAEKDKEGYVVWEMYENGAVLEGDGKAYHRYELPVGYVLNPDRIYVFAESTEDYHRVYGLSAESDVVWVPMSDTLYLTEEGRSQMDAFLEGNVAFRRLKYAGNDEKYSDLTDDFMADLDAAVNATSAVTGSADVTVLANAQRYDVTAWDSHDCVFTVEGAIYPTDTDAYFYVDYRTLNNSYFDADGNFSYRKGNVRVTYLNGDMADALDDVIADASRRYVDYAYEEDEYGVFGDDGNDIVGVMITVTLSDILLPIVPLVVGLVLPHSKKMGYPKRWYIMSAISLAWLIVGVIRLLLLLL